MGLGTIRTATNLFWNRQTPNPCQYLRPDSRNGHGNDPAAVKIPQYPKKAIPTKNKMRANFRLSNLLI
ncbi:conserved hypothetical protein [Planktothrix agardhii]|uniref:Uncharacterized protein n=1 Tax=Planktothrix agardhii TaxID=1160 RepID=A0A1J1JAE0_PLAAG|nr:conserved hypothetical protein [Planktothrix agardhii]CUM58379.1 protein of unknown function [Planktothrix agardhii]